MDPASALLDPDLVILDPNLAILAPELAILDPDLAILDHNLAIPDPNLAIPDPNLAILDPDSARVRAKVRAAIAPIYLVLDNKAVYTAILVACGWAAAVMFLQASKPQNPRSKIDDTDQPADQPTDRPTNQQSAL